MLAILLFSKLYFVYSCSLLLPVFGLTSLKVSGILIKVSRPKDGKEQEDILALARLPQGMKLSPERLLGLDDDPAAIGPLDLVGWRERQCQRRGDALQRDKNEVRLGPDLALGLLASRVVECQDNGTAEQRAAGAEEEPDVHISATLAGLGVPKRHGSLAGPEQAGAEAAGDGAHQNEPDVSEAVVAIQARRIDGVPDGAQKQRPVEADAVGHGRAKQAEEAHDGKDEGVGGVDQVRLLCATGTQRVHGVPQAGC